MFPISDSLKSPRFPFVNLFLIGSTIFIFFKELTAINPDAFILQYALIPSRVNWHDLASLFPFVTAIFLHGGILHILANMWFLWVFGDNVEGNISSLPYLFLYFASGIAGNLVQYFINPTSNIPMLGASGAVAGVLGAYFVLFPHAKIKTIVPIFIFLAIFNIPAPVMLGYWFLLQLLSGVSSISPSVDASQGGIAFWAHVGGFLTGMLLVKFFRKTDSAY